MDLGISLVISIFNRTEIFRRSYPTWFEDKTWPDEVHILNDGGGGDLLGAVEEMAGECEVPIYYTHRDKGHEEWSNPAVPHNYLVKSANYPIVLILDPEMAFVTDGLPVIKEFYQDEAHRSSSCSACQSYGLQSPDRCIGWPVEKIIHNASITTDVNNPGGHDVIYYPNTPTSGYRAWWRQRYIDLGGKDERYIGWGYEDLDLHFRQMRLPPKGIDKCLGEIIVVRFAHPIADMSQAGISLAIWKEEGDRAIPENGVVNRDKEWGEIMIREAYVWD